MRRRTWVRILLPALAGCLVSRAECIGPATPCEAFDRARHVFVGTVLETTILASDERLGPIHVDARMRVERVFQGFLAKEGEEIRFEQVFGETWIKPKVNQRYLVFTRHDRGSLLDLCEGTRELQDSYDIAHLEALSQGRAPWTLAGFVRDRTDPERGIPDVEIRFEGPQETVARTSANGTFILFDLPPGSYSMSFAHPDYYWGAAWRKTVEVDRPGCAYSGVSLAPNNSVRGRLIGADGRPAANAFLILRGLPAAWGKYPPGSRVRSATDGTFIFRGLLPGRYILEVPHLRTLGKDDLTAQDAANNPSAYHPGSLDETQASVIQVERSSKGDLGDFRLPAIR